ncbi:MULTISPECIES: hypothetical protein [unclassified Bartonella]|uniref:hypothetical protein n=1 Tax=unclassified Bartonella TaxID=2645622 RepID=UPI0009C2D4EE|nr:MULTISPECIES: hypothetical protein [unclassified Bartonella]AQX28204.1 hypothetical protein BJB15x_008130 [Bartonella sp. JB15]AQX29475.1 hypothetical protein BJB63x_008020 [Bartonella sp. JB63]
MAHGLPTITQTAIARALREAKKQGCELMEIKPTEELLIYLKSDIPIPNSASHLDISSDEYDYDIILDAFATACQYTRSLNLSRNVNDLH